MDEEAMGLHIIFISIIGSILLFTYYAIPSQTMESKPGKAQLEHTAETIVEHSINHTENDDQIHKKEEHEGENITSSTDSHSDSSISETTKAEETKSVVSAGQSSGTSEVADIISMNNPEYKSHKKGIVDFTHEKHVTDYAISCGDCHHDENGTPLELSKGDSVQNCIVCHRETKKPKGEKLDKKQRIAKYHFEAMHANCIGCHKPYNIEKGDPKGKAPAPTSCGSCHPKNK